MIVYDLACAQGHRFEGWFGSADDFDGQKARDLVRCPLCDTPKVERIPSARVNVGKAAEVAGMIAQVKGVTQAEDVTGPYDVIVRAEARNVDELGKMVVAKIQTLEGITRTLTCPVVRI